jgi:hypothetical protein
MVYYDTVETMDVASGIASGGGTLVATLKRRGLVFAESMGKCALESMAKECMEDGTIQKSSRHGRQNSCQGN